MYVFSIIYWTIDKTHVTNWDTDYTYCLLLRVFIRLQEGPLGTQVHSGRCDTVSDVTDPISLDSVFW